MDQNILPASLLSEEKVELIIKSIVDGNKDYLNHIKEEKLPTENGKYHEIWNYIFKNIKKNFSEFPYKCYKISRGKLWEFLAIFNEENSMLYIVMKEDRLKQIKREIGNEFHYIKILNYLNNNFQSEKLEQISIFPQSSEVIQYIKDDLCKMLGDINGKVKVCVDILFSQKNGAVTDISGNIYDYNLDLIRVEPWYKYLKADIDEIIDTIDDFTVENPPIELGVKKLAITDEDNKKNNEKTEEVVASKKNQKISLEGK